MAMSINGYIATTSGDTPWSKEDWNAYTNFIKQKKNMVIGRKTYEIMLKAKEFNKLGNPEVIIVTSEDLEDYDNFTFVKSPEEALEVLNEKGFKEVVVAGGGQLNSSFMQKGLIDEIFVDLEPKLFGNGIKLFADSEYQKNLKLIKVKKMKNTIQLNYQVENGKRKSNKNR